MFGQTDPKLHDVPIGIDATGQRKEFDSMATVDVRSAHDEHSAKWRVGVGSRLNRLPTARDSKAGVSA
jgi:hypothetical protein